MLSSEVKFKQLEDEFDNAVSARHQCSIDETRIDQNDSLRAIILGNVLSDIKKQFNSFKQDIIDQDQILNNPNIEQ